jgi:hypothetical protein
VIGAPARTIVPLGPHTEKRELVCEGPLQAAHRKAFMQDTNARFVLYRTDFLHSGALTVSSYVHGGVGKWLVWMGGRSSCRG